MTFRFGSQTNGAGSNRAAGGRCVSSAPLAYQNTQEAAQRAKLKMSPRSMRIAFQVFNIASPLGWDVTLEDLATATGESTGSVAKVLAMKGWSSRVRATRRESIGWIQDNADVYAGMTIGD